MYHFVFTIKPKGEKNAQNKYVYFIIIINAYMDIGKNNNFMCFHIDLLIGVKSPAMGLFPVHSYKKWASVPVIRTKIIPIIAQRFNCFIMNTS